MVSFGMAIIRRMREVAWLIRRSRRSNVCAPLTPPSHTWLRADIVWAMEGLIGWAGQPEWQQFFNLEKAVEPSHP